MSNIPHSNVQDCKCHTEVLNVSQNERIKIINYITADSSQTIYGTIFYDIDKDMLFFRNRKGMEYELFSKTRPILTTFQQQESITFEGSWKPHKYYYKNNVVTHPKTKDVIIARLNIEGSSTINDSDWSILLPHPKVENRTIELYDEQQKSEIINNGFFDTTEEEDRLDINENEIMEFIDKIDEKKTTTHKHHFNIPFLYGVLVSNSDKYTIDEETGISVLRNNTATDKSIDSSDPDLFQIITIPLKFATKNIFKIPINFIGKNDINYFDFNEKTKNIIIKKNGYYKVTYNIVLYGVNGEVTTYIDSLSETDSDQIFASVREKKCFANDNTYIHHSFPLPIHKTTNNRIEFMCSITTKTETKISLVSVKTWILIELLSEGL